MVRPAFELTEQNAADVVAICRRLDGLPLAVELAASRSKLLSPAALLARLTSTVDLQAGAAGRPARHETLRDTIAWSYDLLVPPMQAGFRHLGVFAGGADLAAVSSLAAPAAGQRDPLDVVVDLVDVSLAQVADDLAGEPRVSLLQTVADFAVDRLAAEGELDDARQRHAEHFLALAEQLTPQLWTGRELPARAQLQSEADNFRAALNWALQPDAETAPPAEQARLGLRLCAELYRFWSTSGYLGESRRWYERAIELDSGADSLERAQVLLCFAFELYWPHGDARAFELREEALAISRRLGDAQGISSALTSLAEHYMRMGDIDRSSELIEESMALYRQRGDTGLGFTFVSNLQAHVARQRGEYERADRCLHELQDLADGRGNEVMAVFFEIAIAENLASSGRAHEARERLNGVVAAVVKSANFSLIINLTSAYSHVFARLGAFEPAARLLGAHWACLSRIGLQASVESEGAWLRDSGLDQVRETLGELTWNTEIAAGGSYPTEDALAYAQQVTTPG